MSTEILAFQAILEQFGNFHALAAAWHRKTKLYENCAIRADVSPVII